MTQVCLLLNVTGKSFVMIQMKEKDPTIDYRPNYRFERN